MEHGSLTEGDIHKTLQHGLPFVYIPPTELLQFPALASILLQVSTRVDCNGLLKRTLFEYEEVCARLDRELSSYHQTRTIQDLLERMAIGSAQGPRADPAASVDDQLCSALDECLSMAELESALLLLPDTTAAPSIPDDDGGDTSAAATLLGFSAGADLTPSVASAQTLVRLPAALDRQVALMSRRLVDHVTADLSDPHDDGTVGCVSDVASEVSSLLQTRDSCCTRLQQLRERRDLLLLRHAQLIGSLLNKQLKQIREYQLDLGVGAQEKEIAHISATIKALKLKARLMEVQVLADTYTDVTMPALRAADRRLRHLRSECDGRLTASERQLHAYGQAGARFTAVAQRHGELTQLLAQKRWLLREMDAMASDECK